MTRIHLILIGDELLSGKRQDLHLRRIASSLERRGARVESAEILLDLPGEVARAVEGRLEPDSLIITTGGLGPTLDDLTREALSEATGVRLVEEPSLWESLKKRYERAGRKLSSSNRSQTLVPEKGTFFPNDRGTAPGLVFEPDSIANCRVIALPGPPRELNPMWDHQVLAYLDRHYDWPAPPISVMLRFVMMGESSIDEAMRPLLAPYPDVGLSSLIRIGRVDVTLSLASEYPDGRKLLRGIAEETRNRFPKYVYEYTERFDTVEKKPLDLEEVVSGMLLERNEKLAVAESCTGGLLGKSLTDFPGSSRVFLGGVVSYDDKLKRELLGVSEATLGKFGAVSEETATEMVQGLLGRTGADWGLSVTGIAGPEGGSDTKPVGLVYVGIGGSEGVKVSRYEFTGGRDVVRHRSVVAALRLLWLKLKDSSDV